MKRLDIIQLAIILAGIISALFFVQAIPSFLIYMYTWFTGGLSGGYFMQAFITAIINLAAYLLITIYAIKNSKAWAEKICDKTNFNSDINFALDKGELLFSIFISIGVYGIIKTLPLLLTDVYKALNFSSLADDKATLKNYIATNIIFIALYICLMVYAKVFADFFAKKINNVEPPDAITLKEDKA